MLGKLVLLTIALLTIEAYSLNSIVETEYGYVQGVITDSARYFKGIPYASPPVGILRWAPTQPPSSWSGNLTTTKWKPSCPQICSLPPNCCPTETSEDCLYLNVYTPLEYRSSLLPVMVFIHGGRFEQGGSGTILYEGQYFVNRTETVLVTVSYRLGVLGWLTTNDLTGNYALLDQRMALQWVQSNIENFGGDPSQVTLFGESAGASSTVAHIISPLSKGLFSQAIIESNPFTLPMKPAKDAVSLGELFESDVGCTDNLQCLQGKTVEEILEAQAKSESHLSILEPLYSFLPWTPTVDGNQLTMEAIDAFYHGEYQEMPIIIGCVTEEVNMFIYEAFDFEISDADYVAGIGDIFLEKAVSVLSTYPPKPLIGDKRPLLSVLGTDYIFLSSTRNVSDSLIQNSNEYNDDIYFYMFDHVISFGEQAWGPNFTECWEHVCHGAELPFIWHNLGGFQFTPEEEALADSMIQYWANFAHTGNPNTGLYDVDIPWPNWDESEQYLNFSTPNSVQMAYREDYLDFWNELGFHWGW